MVWAFKGDKVKAANGRLKQTWAKSDLRELKRLYVNEAMTLRDVASYFGFPHSTMQNVLNDNGIMRKKVAKKTLETDKRKVLRLYESGKTSEEIAVLYGVNVTAVFKFLARHGATRSLQEAFAISKGRKKYFESRVTSTIKEKAVIDVSKLDYKEYKAQAIKMANAVVRKHGNLILKGKSRTGLHLDHKLSIFDGYNKYRRPISLAILSHPANLQLVTPEYNVNKGKTSILTLKELKARIAKFEKVHGEIHG